MAFFVKRFLILVFTVGVFLLSSQQVLAAATMSLSPVSGTFSTGQTFDVLVNVNTGGASVSGVDALINFDQTKLNLVEVVEGSIFQQYVGESINNSSGFFQISGLASSQSNVFTGSGTLVTMRFKAYSPGTAAVTFRFTSGSTTDSNVADFSTSSDILASVTNASYTITGDPISIGTADSTTTGTSSTNLTPTAPLPVTATGFPTLAVIVSGMLFLFIGYIASVKINK